MPPPRSKPQPRPIRKPEFEVVDPIWLLKALAICFAAALLCGYATLCLLFYQGEWQLILHPTHTIDRTPATVGLAYNDVLFDSTKTGQPRLTAWWIPATPDSVPQPLHTAPTILYLHDASGSLSAAVPTLTLLHQTGVNIFAIDYRGFGASDSSQHPSESRMAEDTAAALDYLTTTRHISVATIIPYGVGLAASLAANLAHAHPTLPAIVLDNPIPDPSSLAIAAHPSGIVPVRLLFGDQFNIATPLATLATPKLLLSGGPTHPTSNLNPAAVQSLFTHAASPRTTVTLPADTSSGAAYRQLLGQFLNQYLAQNASSNNP